MRRLCIVAHGAPLLYGYLIVAFERDREGPDSIEIVVDRRRAGSGAPAVDRRKPSDVDREIQTHGFVVLDENGAIVRDLEPPPEERPPAWKAQALHARDRIETAWRSLPAAWPSLPALPSVTSARDRLETARQQSLSTVTRAREGLQSGWQAVAAMANAAPAPSPGRAAAPGERGRLPRRPRTLWMLGGAIAAVAAAAAFVALEPPDPPDPAAARDARVTPSPIVAPSAAVETPAPEITTARPETTSDRAPMAAREAPATTTSAARETPAAPQPATPAAPQPATAVRETPAPRQTAAFREAPAPRHLAATRAEAPPDASPSGPPRVEIQSDAAGRAEERTITYTARLSDARGQPLVNAEVSLHGWLPDGSDLQARLTSTSTPGVYRARVPVGPRTPSNLRVLVTHGGKRFEVAPQRRAL